MNSVKLWLDDERPEPDGWVCVKTAREAIKILSERNVIEVSFDHDLGDTNIVDCGTGYDAISWLEFQVMTDDTFPIPVVHIHTANASARIKMSFAARNIDRKRLLRMQSI